MSFTWLLPGALLLTALVAGPILAHMTRRRPEREVPFGATLLLRRLARKLRRRRHLRDPLILVLRALAVLLVVAAAAAPQISWPEAPPPGSGPSRIVVVLDDSMSMGHRLHPSGEDQTTLFERAIELALADVRALPAGSTVGLVTLSGAARAVSVGPVDPDSALSALTELRQGSGRTDLGGGLRLARQMLDGQGGRVYVYTDEAGPGVVSSASEELALLAAQGGELRPVAVHPDQVGNLFVSEAVYGQGLEGGTVRLVVTNHGDSAVEVPVTVELPDGTEIHAFVDAPALGQGETRVTVPRVAQGGVASARLTDPFMPLDDVTYFHLPQLGANRVLVVDGDPGATPVASEVYFLERALAPWGSGGTVGGALRPEVIGSAGVTELDPNTHRVVFLANIADPGPLAARLETFVKKGGAVVISLGSNATADRYNTALAGILPGRLRKARGLVAPGETGLPTTLPDLGLDFFEPFRRGGRSAFGNAHWRRVFTLDDAQEREDVRVLLEVQGGLPLLVEREVGLGRVMLLTSTLDLGWGDFPLQSAYMPFVQRLVGYLGGASGGGGLRLTGNVGALVPIDLPEGVLEVAVVGPDGPVSAPVRDGRVRLDPKTTGAYRVGTLDGRDVALVAVNGDPLESDVRREEGLLAVAAEADPERYLRKEPLAPWLLGLGMLAAIAQALLSARRDPETVEDADVAA